jgi:hypothetical protein
VEYVFALKFPEAQLNISVSIEIDAHLSASCWQGKYRD